MCHRAFLDPQHFKMILPNPPELELVIIRVYKQKSGIMGNANIPTSSPRPTSDDESPVSIIFLSVVVLSQVSRVPHRQHCKLIKTRMSREAFVL